MTKPPLGHTLVVLGTLVGSFAVLAVYAVGHEPPPGEIIAMVTALTTGSASTYLAPRQGPTGPPGGTGETGPDGATGPAGSPATDPTPGPAAAAAGPDHE